MTPVDFMEGMRGGSSFLLGTPLSGDTNINLSGS